MSAIKQKKTRKLYIKLRVDEEEMAKVHALMSTYGFPTVSCFLRDILFRKRITPRNSMERMSENDIRKHINQMIYQVQKIGVNYNQIVAVYQNQAKQMKMDGTPAYNSRNFEEKLDRLNDMTIKVRDEVKALAEYLNDALNQQQ